MVGVVRGRPTLDIRTQSAKVRIRSRRPKMKIRSSRPQMNVRRKAPAFRIRRSKKIVRGHRKATMVQISPRFRRQPVISASRYNKRYRRGDDAQHVQLDHELSLNSTEAMIEKRLDETPSINDVNAVIQQQMDVEWDKGYFEVDWTQGSMEIEWDLQSRPDIQVEPHSVEIRLRHNQNIVLKIREKAIKKALGNKVDKRV